MRLRRIALGLGLALALGACGQQGSVSSTNLKPAAPAEKLVRAGALQKSATAEQKPAEQPSDLPTKITRMNEDGSETVEDVPSDSGAHNPLLAAVASTVAAGASPASAAPAASPTQWQEGTNYTRIVPTQPTDAPAGQVEVLEFFWYACPHCNSIQPLVDTWKKTKPAYVTFTPVHVMWNDAHRALARLYYTMVTLGKIDQVHAEIFKEIHVRGNPLMAADPANLAETENIQAAFAARLGISDTDFRQAYHSFAVQTALQHADQLVQRYRVDGVPTFVVNGKYVADVRSADGPERLISLVSDLATQEHKR